MSELKENAPLRPAARVAHVDPNAPQTAERQPLPAAVAKRPQEQKTPAEWAYERVILYIKNFEDQLDADHEVGMGFAGAEAGTMHIHGVGYFAPDLISFYGVDERGLKSQLIQHVSQLNVLLRALPKKADRAKPARIGFRLAQDLERV